MASFIKVHHVDDDNEIEEWIVNLETITAIDEENHRIDLVDGDSICIARNNEWEKIINWVKFREIL